MNSINKRINAALKAISTTTAFFLVSSQAFAISSDDQPKSISIQNHSCMSFGFKKSLKENADRAFSPSVLNSKSEKVEKFISKFSSQLGGDSVSCNDKNFYKKVSEFVNNEIKYSSSIDQRFFEKTDYWQTPEETLTPKVKSTGELVGDCEDLAILKIQLIQSFGCYEAKPRLALVARGGEEHAVVVVEPTTFEYTVLDNFKDDDGKLYRETVYSQPGQTRFLLTNNTNTYLCGIDHSQAKAAADDSVR